MIFEFSNMKNQHGQTLLEATIALAALLIIISATTTAVITSVNNSIFVKNQNNANKLAQEGMEFMRKVKTDNYIYFISLRGNPVGVPSYYCIPNSPSYPPALTPSSTNADSECADINISNTDFDRRVTITKMKQDNAAYECSFQCSGPGCAAILNDVVSHSVLVEVAWSSGKCASGVKCHKAQVKSCFINNL